MPSPRTPAQRGRNYTVNIRMSRDEIEAARKLGSGNVSMGFRQAIRYAMDRAWNQSNSAACCVLPQ
jgi:post-segregation antitoxin (ccd killing protein)